MPFGAVIGSQIMMLSASPSDGEAIFSFLKVACFEYVMISGISKSVPAGGEVSIIPINEDIPVEFAGNSLY